jgi:hypothetical protein
VATATAIAPPLAELWLLEKVELEIVPIAFAPTVMEIAPPTPTAVLLSKVVLSIEVIVPLPKRGGRSRPKAIAPPVSVALLPEKFEPVILLITPLQSTYIAPASKSAALLVKLELLTLSTALLLTKTAPPAPKPATWAQPLLRRTLTSERLALLASAKNLKGTSPALSSVPFWMVRVPLVIAEAMTGKALSPANRPTLSGTKKL